MIRVTIMFSVVFVSLLTSACQKENKKNPAPAASPNGPIQPQLNGQQQPMPGSPGNGSPDIKLPGSGDDKSSQNHTSTQRADDGTIIDADTGTPAQSGADQAFDVPKPPAPKAAAASETDTAAAAAPAASSEPAQSSVTQEAPAAAAPVTAAPPEKAAAPAGQPPAALQQNPPEPQVATLTFPTPPISPTLYTVVHADDPNFPPGLAHEPAVAPNSTDFENFTDGAADPLMGKALAGLKRDANLLKSNEDLAATVTGLQLATADGKLFTLAVDLEQPTTRLVFSGSRKTVKQTATERQLWSTLQRGMSLPAKSLLRAFELELDTKQSTQGLTYTYRAHIFCSDETSTTCQNAMIEIRKYDLNAKGKAKKTLAKIFAVHRLGPAIITYTPQRAVEVNKKVLSPSTNLRVFDQYLIDTGFNVCIAEKEQANADVKALSRFCQSNNKLMDAASYFLARMWAVAKGRAAYELIFANHELANEVYFPKSLVIRGALVKSPDAEQALATVEDRAQAGRDQWFKEIRLVNSDGAGALNFEIQFSDEGMAKTIAQQRISITTDFLKAYSPEVRHEKKPALTSDATPTTVKPKHKKIKAS
jgi:hypothetical protein